MKKLLLAFLLLVVLLVGAVPERAAAFDANPKWLQNVYGVYDNKYLMAYSPWSPLVDFYPGGSVFYSEVAVYNGTDHAVTLRTKTYGYYTGRLPAATPGYFYYDTQYGATIACYNMYSGYDGFGCRLVMPPGSLAVAYSVTSYTGVHTGASEWFQTTYLMYNDDYSQLITGMNIYTTLH